jgi:hypothetical protein
MTLVSSDEARARQLTDGLEQKIAAWFRKEPHDKAEYAFSLPWWAHEGSRVLELLIPRYRSDWSDVRLRRAHDHLQLVFVR